MSAPSAPITDIWPSCSSGQIMFFWRPPTSDGGSPITKYTLACSAIAYSQDVSANVSNFLVTGLTNGTDYSFTITATNVNGAGPAATFETVQPGVTPFGPTVATASTFTTSTALITWTPSTIANEGSTRGYIIECYPMSNSALSSFSQTQDSFLSSILFESLSTNQYYQFLVRGINDVGYCPPFAYTSTLGFGIIPISVANFSPSSIAALNLWLDANDPYNTGTTPATSTMISTIFDKSGRSRNATAGTSLIETNSLNSNATIRFTGTSYYNITYASFPTSYSIFTIYRTTSNTGSWQRLMNSSNDQYLFIGTGSDSSNVATFVGNGTWNDTTANTPAISILNNFRLLSLTNNGTTLSPFVDGSNQNTKTGTTATFSNFTLGRVLPSTHQFYGNMAEMVIYTETLPTYYRQQVEGYLASKWGLQSNLPTTHPYRVSTPQALPLLAPSSIGGLSIWLDGADTTTMTFTGGSNITQWNDKSGFARHATKLFGSNPAYVSSNFNNRGSVFVNGSNQAMRATVPEQTFASSITMFGVFQKTGAQQTNESPFARNNAYPATPVERFNNQLVMGSQAPTPGSIMNYQTQTSLTMINFFARTAGVGTGLWSEWSNANPSLTDYSIAGTYSDACSSFHVGSRTDGATSFVGNVCEVMAFNSTLLVSERQKVEGYLAWKWGLVASIPNQHPFKFYPPLANYSSIRINTSTVFATNFNAGNDIGFTNFSNAQLVSTPTSTINGLGSAYNTSNVTTSNAPLYTFSGSVTTNRATFCASVYRRTATSGGGIIFSRAGGGANGLNLNTANGTDIGYYWNNGSNTSNFNPGSAATIPLNTWTHIAVTIAPTEARFYLNGSNVATNTTTHSNMTLSDMTIGIQNSLTFPGFVDNVRFYTSTLTAEEVQAIYYNTQFV